MVSSITAGNIHTSVLAGRATTSVRGTPSQVFTWLGVPRTLVVALPASTLVWMLPAVMLLTMLGTGVVNVSLDRLAYKPLRRAARLAALITAVGGSFALENIMQNWYGPSQITYPNVFSALYL